ncbi:MAG: tryptophan synthase subunit beta like protein [Halomonas sp.]|nr:tryptophan synthase subunit beta like protein [Halomonas sp.]
MFVSRDADGEIRLVSRIATPDCMEYVASDSPELLAFLEQEGDAHLRQLQDSDLAFVRVLEDVIELLIAKGVISFTDLPQAARDKLLKRQTMRRQVNSVELLGDDEEWLI